ncbi:hypothetical protein NPIL_141501 [Nephila pilipes]|uniref:Uncharacterized protein n=1 Tax=Nephila pilipes TaxID=299642 RepID=A0A8X6NSG8_NEPPI|nr:hypothetical protein NPIL_141501 [Nephila pilipes]
MAAGRRETVYGWYALQQKSIGETAAFFACGSSWPLKYGNGNFRGAGIKRGRAYFSCSRAKAVTWNARQHTAFAVPQNGGFCLLLYFICF